MQLDHPAAAEAAAARPLRCTAASPCWSAALPAPPAAGLPAAAPQLRPRPAGQALPRALLPHLSHRGGQPASWVGSRPAGLQARCHGNRCTRLAQNSWKPPNWIQPGVQPWPRQRTRAAGTHHTALPPSCPHRAPPRRLPSSTCADTRRLPRTAAGALPGGLPRRQAAQRQGRRAGVVPAGHGGAPGGQRDRMVTALVAASVHGIANSIGTCWTRWRPRWAHNPDPLLLLPRPPAYRLSCPGPACLPALRCPGEPLVLRFAAEEHSSSLAKGARGAAAPHAGSTPPRGSRLQAPLPAHCAAGSAGRPR